MSIEAACPCGARFMAIPQLAGKKVSCPTCGQSFQVPRPLPPTFPVACPCGRIYQVKREMAGRQVKCTACGGRFIVPGNTGPGATSPRPQAANTPSPVSSFGGPLDNLGDLSSFHDPLAHPPPAYNSPPGPSFPTYAYSLPAPQPKRRPRKPINKSVFITAGLSALALSAIIAIGVVAFVWWPFNLNFGFGYLTPHAAFAAMKQAQIDRDWKALLGVLSPESRERLVGAFAGLALMMSDQDAELSAILQKYGVQADAAAPPPKSLADFGKFNERMKETMGNAAKQITDQQGFFVELMAYFEKKGAQSGKQFDSERFMKAAESMELVDLKIDGDTARGMQTSGVAGRARMPIEFRRVNGGWYVHLPESGMFGAF